MYQPPWLHLHTQMGLPRKHFPLFSLFLVLFAKLEHFPQAESASDYTTLVYKGCAKQALSDPTGVYSQAISALFGTLIAQSSKSKFFKATTGSGQTTVSGLFQCRGDLSNVDCYNCVSKLPILIDKLCGQLVAARVQLLGCYMLYEIAGFPQVSGMDLLYKTCSGKNAPGSGFEEKRDTALSSLENGIGSGNGFYTTSYSSVYVLGQCEGDLGSADCGDCVKSAVQRSQVECGSSISGQVYLNKCFISYSFYPNGVPKSSSSSSPSSSSSSSTSSASSYDSLSSPSGQDTKKTVAIILGGALGVGFIVICLMFAKGLMKET
ncbi:plasmodesmata-located protein 2-like isoform X2 [Diospyros lotus]|uniref:plasmodesmata-located protein 2-like isoform X2 n=1 Tax=Diospyros lotus TaxID=55363 RepID=UPI00225ABA42|nr:plasmodesmata-located protein 2-like isoform X2 [Diospyros lotus]XP_052189353.1 plasmodesmata-located protein 2-like isoform X2 [Diospyros lotus]